MSIGPAEAEGTDSCNVPLVPITQRCRNFHRGRLPIDMATRCMEMQVSGDLLVLQHQDNLDQAGNTCSRLQMADIGFDSADPQWFGPLTENLDQSIQFNGISKGRPRAM